MERPPKASLHRLNHDGHNALSTLLHIFAQKFSRSCIAMEGREPSFEMKRESQLITHTHDVHKITGENLGGYQLSKGNKS